MIRIPKIRRHGIILSFLALPVFILLAGWAAHGHFWWVSLGILGSWGFFFLFATSYWFQFLVVLLASLYALYEHIWPFGVIGLLLSAYLYYAAQLPDANIARVSERISSKFPGLAMVLEPLNNLRGRLILLIVFGVLAAILGYVVRRLSP